MIFRIDKQHVTWIALIALGIGISGCTMAESIVNLDQGSADSAEQLSVSSAQVNSDLTMFDLSNNGVIDDDEFFRATDMWIASDISNQTFFEVIDAWSSQAQLGEVSMKSDEPDKSRIRVYRSTAPRGGMYIIGMPGAVEPEARVIIRDEMNNVGMATAEFDGSFRFSSFDLPDGFDHTLGARVEVTQQEEGKHWSNPTIIIIQFN